MNNKIVIGIAGPSGGGKTTVTRKIVKEFNDQVVVINLDDYYKDQTHLSFDERVTQNYDHPNAFDVELIISDVRKLVNGEDIDKPVYDFTNHTRSEEHEHVKSKKIIIIEGLFTLLFDELRELLDIKVFVETDPDVCFIRRLVRDMNERGRTQESVINQYLLTVKPMQETFINPTRKNADIVVLHGGENQVFINMITNTISYLLDTTI